MRMRNVASDRQSQAASAGMPATRRLKAHERLEYAFALVDGDARTIVAERDLRREFCQENGP